jgi:hypothetical protein
MVRERKEETDMDRKLIIDGNAVYEIDENCMLKKQMEGKETDQNTEEKEEKLNIYKMKRTE